MARCSLVGRKFSIIIIIIFFFYRTNGDSRPLWRVGTDLSTGWTVWGSNLGGGEIFPTRPDQPGGPPSLLHNGYRVFHWGKAVGAWRWPPTPSIAEVKERVELYLYSPSGLSWSVIGWTFNLRELATWYTWIGHVLCLHVHLSVDDALSIHVSKTLPLLQDKIFPLSKYAIVTNVPTEITVWNMT